MCSSDLLRYILDTMGRHQEALAAYRRALTPALLSALELDAARFQFLTERDRLAWLTEKAAPTLTLALDLTSRSNRPDLASDLIAISRTGGSIDITITSDPGQKTNLGLITPGLATAPEPAPY